MNEALRSFEEENQKMNGRKISILAVFVGLSVVGASIKVPGIIGSVALDSFPALLAASFFGGGAGAIVAGFGHMVSAILGGLPMGPLHFLVAVEMAVLAFVFARLREKRVAAGLFFVIGNVFVAPLPFIFIYDLAFYLALLPSLFIGSLINVVVAYLLIPRLKSFFHGVYHKGAVKG